MREPALNITQINADSESFAFLKSEPDLYAKSNSKPIKIAFVDRDGTIIWEPERPSDVDPRETFPLTSAGQVRFLTDAIDGLKLLLDKGFKLVLVTNQTFLGTPKHPQVTFDQVMDRMLGELKKQGVEFDFIMVCPHGPDDGCDCRKPKIGGVKTYLEKRPNVSLSASLMFGDRATDGEFAKNLGVRFVEQETNGPFVAPNDI